MQLYNLPSDRSLRNSYLVLFMFCGVLVAALALLDALQPAGRSVVRVGGVDPPCYFGVAHSLVFDRDFDLTNEFQHVKPEDRRWTPVQQATGRPGSPYAIGYSLMAMPFLAGGALVDGIAGHRADGYGRLAMFGYSTTNVLLVGFGLIVAFTLLVAVAKSYGASDRRAAAVGLLVVSVIFFGTNVGFYAFSPMAHAATFFWACVFLAWWWRIRSDTNMVHWAILGVMGGMLSISRWQELSYLAAPIALDLLEARFRAGGWLRSRAAYGMAAVLCWIPQLLEWKSIYGQYFHMPPQASHDFRFPPVEIPLVLFSSCSGWFFWTPVTLLGVAGLVYGAVRLSRFYWPLLLIIALELCIVGSLRTFWSGIDSFSARYLTSSVPLAAIGLMTILLTAPPFWKRAAMVATSCCVVYTCLFAVQFRLDLVPRNERLTAAESFTDKLFLLRAARRKAAVRTAQMEISNGEISGAVETLEAAKAAYGEDRDVLRSMVLAYKAAGRTKDTAVAERRLNRLLNSRLM